MSDGGAFYGGRVSAAMVIHEDFLCKQFDCNGDVLEEQDGCASSSLRSEAEGKVEDWVMHDT